jgi:hypothetical protein
MITFQIKNLFFDRPLVLGKVGEAKRKVLSKIGAVIRTTARQSIRRRKAISAPGDPPSAHAKGTASLKTILFGYDQGSDSVVIGPVVLNTGRRLANRTVPNLMEFGGTVRTTSPQSIRVGAGRDARGRFLPDRIVRVKAGSAFVYRPRPFMGPALESEQPKLPLFWASSIRSG